MREILFRGKRTDNHQWVEGYYIVDDMENPNPYIVNRWKHRIAHKTVGQYTGLKDKNGKRIFEGDIIKFGDNPLVVFWNDEAFGWYAKKRAGYAFMQFGLGCTDWDYIDLGWIAAEVPCVGKMTTEVIGNIHDNPELIGESK